MIASLMMYDRPELTEAHARYWASIRKELGARGLDSPAELSNDTSVFDVWLSPDLVLSQTCGMPYRQRLHEKVTLVGTPDFGLEECPPGYYRSAIVVRADDSRDSLMDFKHARLAFNNEISQSGFASINVHSRLNGFSFSKRVESGSHLNSARAVANNEADIAALDAVSWRLMMKYEDWTSSLRVLEWTFPTPGLPYISRWGVDAKVVFEAVDRAIQSLSQDDRSLLGIQGLVWISPEHYLEVPDA